MGHGKGYKWIRGNKPRLDVDYLRLDEFCDAYSRKLNEARIRLGEPLTQHDEEIMKELRRSTCNNFKCESANIEFQEALNKACLADPEYHQLPSVKWLTKISSELIDDWQDKNDRRLHKRDREEVGTEPQPS